MAVTGSSGRLGRAVVEAARRRGIAVIEWTRAELDLDNAGAAVGLVERDRPRLVIHCAAWTNVDGCALDPELATRRNATAVGELAAACVAGGSAMLHISTNEVFDGRRVDAVGYIERDEVRPINSYGASKAAGERLAKDAFDRGGRSGRLWIVRTAWLFGPPGNDFPTRIVAAADALDPGVPLAVVSDEFGSPTYTIDLAPALLALVDAAPGDVYHLAAAGSASRHDVASAVVGRCRPQVAIEPIGRTDYPRPSTPPAWSVLDSGRAAAYGVRLRPWQEAVAEYAGTIC